MSSKQLYKVKLKSLSLSVLELKETTGSKSHIFTTAVPGLPASLPSKLLEPHVVVPRGIPISSQLLILFLPVLIVEVLPFNLVHLRTNTYCVYLLFSSKFAYKPLTMACRDVSRSRKWTLTQLRSSGIELVPDMFSLLTSLRSDYKLHCLLPLWHLASE